MQVFDEVRVEAAVIMGGNVDAVEIDMAYAKAISTLNRRVPCILCNEQAEKFGCVGVHTDTEKKAMLAIEHLYKKGYRTVGLLGGASSGQYSRYPTVFFYECMKRYAAEYGITIRKDWIYGDSYDEKDGEAAMKALLSGRQLPRAVCCINDHVAYGAMFAAQDAGFRIPQDIAVMGNDNVHIAGMMRPSLTTVASDFEKLGSLIFEKILERKRGEETGSCMVEPVLIEREST